MLLSTLLRWIIKSGDLTMIDAEGRTHRYGEPGGTPKVVFRLHDKALHWKLVTNPDLHLGEAYMDGTLTIEDGTLYDLLKLFGVNILDRPLPWAKVEQALLPLFRRLQQYNPIGRAQENVAHHYDLSDQLYDLFLDADRQYSCAYFTHPDATLDQAQYDKKRHIAAKLLLEPGMRVLDIGCGWGGLALYLAKVAGVEVVGLTLSKEQHAVACRRAEEAGLAGQVQFRLQDYREDRSQYDRIVSVGMFEHVGVVHYPEFFAQVKRLLKPDGVAMIHSIGRVDGPGTTNAWLRKYIFPGGYAPALSEVMPSVERSGLYVTDIEILRLHYAETLKEWHRRFQAHRAEIAELYDERFCRMWEFYLIGAEIDFRYLGTMVFQMQLSREIDAVPLLRDYMVDWERAHP